MLWVVQHDHICAKDIAPNNITVIKHLRKFVNESRKEGWYLNCLHCFVTLDKSGFIALEVSYLVDFVCPWSDAFGSFFRYLVLNREIRVLFDNFVFVLDVFWHIDLCFKQLNSYFDTLKYTKFCSLFPTVSIKIS